jgi:hypothetical protein
VSINGLPIDPIGKHISAWMEAGALLAYVRSTWNLKPINTSLSPFSKFLGEKCANDEVISNFALAVNGTLEEVGLVSGISLKSMNPVTSRLALVMELGHALLALNRSTLYDLRS